VIRSIINFLKWDILR